MKRIPENELQTDAPQVEETREERTRRLYLARKAERLTAPTAWLEETPTLEVDTLWRGLTRGGEARLLVVRATQSVQESVRRLSASDDVAQLLGELMVATLLVRSTLNPEERMQVLLNHKGPTGQMVVDAWDSGGIRAYVANPAVDLNEVGYLVGEGILQVSRSRGARSYQSMVGLSGGSVSEFMMGYLLESEQILSLLRIEVEVEGGVVKNAVGYLVQLMPEGSREDLSQMTSNLEGTPPLVAGMTPEDADARAWAETLMRGFRWDQCAREHVTYKCRCSEDRILSMLASLPRHDIQDLASGTELLEMTCDYCKTIYKLRPAQVAILLDKPS